MRNETRIITNAVSRHAVIEREKKIVHAFPKSISSGVADASGEGCRGTATSFSRGLRLGCCWEGGSAALGVPAVRRVSALGCGWGEAAYTRWGARAGAGAGAGAVAGAGTGAGSGLLRVGGGTGVS